MTVTELPALALRPLIPSQPLPLPQHYDVVVFVSRYAAKRYLELLTAHQGNRLSWPAQTTASTVGASSARVLFEAGISAENIVHPPVTEPNQDSEALLAALQARGVMMRRVLIVRGTQGREWLAAELARREIGVDFLPVYERVPAPWTPDRMAELEDALQQPDRCIFLLTSSEGVQAMAARLDHAGVTAAWFKAAFIVIHERIGATLQSVSASLHHEGVSRLVSCLPDDDSIVQTIRAVAGPTA